MKIIFSPEYSGTVYVKSANRSNVMMDTVVVNTIGLINMLELRLGLHYENISEHERVAMYYDAMCKYMKANPKNVLAKSFKTSGLSTAKAVLAWRDELRSAEWKFNGEDISQRLQVIVGVEKYFRKINDCDLADRLHIVTNQVIPQKLNCKDWTIYMPCDIDLLKPATKQLLETLGNSAYCGAEIFQLSTAKDDKTNLATIRRMIANGEKGEISINPEDESLLIYRFPDECAANEYLAYKGMGDADVWINADNKQLDNWLALMGKPLTGSVMNDCSPQLTQLFVMGVGLFDTPLNVNTLIEWLNMPVHPINQYFRNILANAIVEEGGYRNNRCKDAIEKYVSGAYVYLSNEEKQLSEEELQKLREKDKKMRTKLVEMFLPSLEKEDYISTEVLKAFVAELSSWARQKAHFMAEKQENNLWGEQLSSVALMADVFRMLLNTLESEDVDYKTVDSWISTIYTKNTFTNAIAEKGCHTVVNSPAKVISVADKTVWMGVEGDDSHNLECSFLYPTEREKLREMQCIHAWDEQKENHYHERMTLTPLMQTQKQLILVVCEHRNGELTQKHPLMVRLEQQVKDLKTIIRYPKLDESNMEKVEIVENAGVSAELKFEHADLIKWPDHISPTSIGTLAEYPFDYMMERLLNITADGKAQMADVKATKGNVAHAVIEALFAPRNNKRYSMPDEIATRIVDEYETVYHKTIEAKGAVLQLSENKLTGNLLHEQLRSCLDTLLEILKENSLKVTGCEHYVEDDMKLGLPKATDKEGNIKDRDVLGFIDMTLEDKDGHPVLFDFKWTSSKSYYQRLLEENRSVQLEIYRHLLTKTKKDTVEKVAYYLMPEARLYSKAKFEGKHCTQLNVANTDSIIQQLRNSIIYRKKQIESGVIETNGAFNELQYVKDTDTEKLFPLIEDKEQGIKKENRFTNYGLFNA